MSAPGDEAGSHVLRVDWPRCRARGLCAELLPERIVLDEWGYPVVLGPVSQDQGVGGRARAHTADSSRARRRGTVPGRHETDILSRDTEAI